VRVFPNTRVFTVDRRSEPAEISISLPFGTRYADKHVCASDIEQAMYERERRYMKRLDVDCLARHKDLNPAMRTILVDWITEVRLHSLALCTKSVL